MIGSKAACDPGLSRAMDGGERRYSAAAFDAVPAAPDFGLVECLAAHGLTTLGGMMAVPVVQVALIGVVARGRPQDPPEFSEGKNHENSVLPAR